jgi:hypothetical protein
MLHIVFQQPDIDTLQKAIALDPTLEGEIIQIKDEFAVGPVADIYETEGYQLRRDWWKKVLENSPYTEQLDIVDDKLTVHQLKEKLKDDATGLDLDGTKPTRCLRLLLAYQSTERFLRAGIYFIVEQSSIHQ